MEGKQFLVFTLILWVCHITTIQCRDCQIIEELNGTISDKKYDYSYEKCWTIVVPEDHTVELRITEIEASQSCSSAFVRIDVEETREQYTFCSSTQKKRYPVYVSSNVTVTHKIKSSYGTSSFTLKLKVVDKDSSIFAIRGVFEAKDNALSWLNSARDVSYGWKEFTSRAVVALHLSSEANFSKELSEEKLMAKQAELRTAVNLLRSPLTSNELSLSIHALMVTCHDPRQFYGNNLVKRLKEQVENTKKFTHPIAYVALCNANEPWPSKAISDLKQILRSNSKIMEAKDLQAMAVMALSCLEKRSAIGNSSFEPYRIVYNEAIQQLKQSQLADGSFGNMFTTSVILQTFISSGQLNFKDWNLTSAVQYLVKELRAPYDFISAYLALPILNEKSLVDISNINCSYNRRIKGDDSFSKSIYVQKTEITVKYSFYIGDEKDVIHSVSLRIPENLTLTEVMKLAEEKDPKYRFDWKVVDGKLIVSGKKFEHVNLTNDPEAGRFWVMYKGVIGDEDSLKHMLTINPNKLIIKDRDHLILWYHSVIP